MQKSFVMLNIYVGIENAVLAYNDDNAPTAAIAGLESLLAAVRDYNEEVQDTDVDFDIVLIEQLIDVMVQNGVAPPTQLLIPPDPWPAD